MLKTRDVILFFVTFSMNLFRICSSSACIDTIHHKCENGGVCEQLNTDTWYCICPPGNIFVD